MKVAQVTAFPADPAQPHGGVEAVSVNLVRALAKRPGLQVHVVTTDPACRTQETSLWDGATIHRLPARSGKLLLYAVGAGRRQVSACLASLKPDVVHAHDTYGLMVKGLALPRVFTVHGFIHEDTRFEGGASAWLRAWLWRQIETAGWAEQPHIVAISPYVRERLRGTATGVVHDIENPISEECFAVRRKPSGDVVFTAAVISERKNTLGLLKAVERLVRAGVKIHLRVAGRAVDEAYGRAVEDFVRRRNLAANVTLLGPISAAQVRAELASAAVFALLSFEEGAPMGIAEAMAAGVPVVTSNRCGMPYMVRHGETGFLVEPEDTEDTARSLQRILDDHELAARMSDRARELARDRFHPDRVAERTHAVYERAVAEFHRTAR
ncbi:MAG: glycosyltransferase family 4 protein [Verrucomicrobia bacterium]|nr:glycosyltransferase family 4 protein [Verrucomicrobiota bacterium]